jgi:hypothetical protein
MPEGAGLDRLVDASAILSTEQQAHIAALHGEDTWTLDTAAATVTLTAPGGGTIVCRAHFVGTSAPGPGTWLWGWRNINDFPHAFVALAERVRAAGEAQGVPELTTAEIPLTRDLPRRLTIAAKTVSGLAAHYSGPIGGGSRAWLLIEHPDLELPAPTARRTADAVQATVESVELADHVEAIASWARFRGVTLTASEPGGRTLRLALPDGEVLVTLDERHRIIQVAAQAALGLDASAAMHEPSAPAAPEAEPEPVVAEAEEPPAPSPDDDPLAALRPEPEPDAEHQEHQPDSPLRRLWDFLRGPTP